ncbi:MAG TPA: hypothetical protein VGN75_17915 [Kaistia sp.]|nr:hypothetical protein [Kaistia sp.]
MSEDLDAAFQPSRLRSLLDHLAVIEEPRDPPKTRYYPLRGYLRVEVKDALALAEQAEI